jgi:hypothetical protein
MIPHDAKTCQLAFSGDTGHRKGVNRKMVTSTTHLFCLFFQPAGIVSLRSHRELVHYLVSYQQHGDCFITPLMRLDGFLRLP